MTGKNDNRAPVKLTVASFDTQPGLVFIAMNRPDAIYGASPAEAREIAHKLLEEADRSEASKPAAIPTFTMPTLVEKTPPAKPSYRIFISHSHAIERVHANLLAEIQALMEMKQELRGDSIFGADGD